MKNHFLSLVEAMGGRVDNVAFLGKIDSTHAMALRLIAQMDEEEQHLRSTVIVAETQTAGRGRLGRRWLSPKGGLYLNWIASDLTSDLVNRLPVLASAAAVTALERNGAPRIAVKWPNDLLIGGAKVGGILVHARHGAVAWATVGLGINLSVTPHPDDNPPRPATSLADHVVIPAVDILREKLVKGFLAHLNEGLADPEQAFVLWRSRIVHRPGDSITVQLDESKTITGSYLGLTDAGHLVLDVEGVRRTISSGDVIKDSSLRR